MAQAYEIVSVRRAKRPPGVKGSYWVSLCDRVLRHQYYSLLPTRGPQGRDEGGGGDYRQIERTALGQSRPRQAGAEEETPQVTIDHP